MRAVATFKRDCEADDDIKLARIELASLIAGPVRELSATDARAYLGLSAVPDVLKNRRIFGFDVHSCDPAHLARRLAFWDYIVTAQKPSNRRATLPSGATGVSFVQGNASIYVSQSQILEWTAYVRDGERLEGVLLNGHPVVDLMRLGDPIVAGSAGKPFSPASRRKNEYLSHGFHKYKAKFFPRLARSLINYTVPLQEGVVLDPFCGSGTTGVEASLLGLRATQFDIDPLSVFISSVKGRLGSLDSKGLNAVAGRSTKKLVDLSPGFFSGKGYQLPQFLLARRPKRLTPEQMTAIENEVTALQEIIQNTRGKDVRDLLRVALSHAIATKVSLRWMGTGDNRYALEIAKRPTQQIFRAQLSNLTEKLETIDALRRAHFISDFGHVESSVSDCGALPLPNESVHAVVTSPPYLPAASGRETYLRSRAASLVALDLMSEKDILETEKAIVGSVLAMPSLQAQVPKSVTELADWMMPQRERTAKARPTVAYFEKLGASLREMNRVLKPGGCAALVVSKEHTFWELTTKKVLRKFDMVEPICEMATNKKFGINMDVDRVETIELSKMDFAARPGAQGAYFEAIIVLRKRVAK